MIVMLWRIFSQLLSFLVHLLIYAIESTAQFGLGTQQGPVSAAETVWRRRNVFPSCDWYPHYMTSHLSFISRYVSFLSI